MTIYTPGAMPINVPMNYAFTLLARLYPSYRPHKVLKIAQGMYHAPGAVAYLLGFILFALSCSPAIIFTSTLLVLGILRWMQIKSKYIDFIVNLGVVFSTIGKLGVISVGLAIFGYYSSGWQGLAAFFGSWILGGIINGFLEAQEKKRVRVLAGTLYSESDRCFIDAYRFCADEIGVTLDPSVSEQEMENNQWKIIYLDYYQQNPVLFEMNTFS